MPLTRPVTRVELVTAAVTERPGPPIVIEVPLTASTWPATNIWVAVPPPPAPGSGPLLPLLPGAACGGGPPDTADGAEGCPRTTARAPPAPAASAPPPATPRASRR